MNYVFDGTGPPEFWICGDDVISNGSFEESLEGWDIDTANLTAQKLESYNTNYGLYVLAVAGMSPESFGYVSCETSFDEDLQGQQVVVSFSLWSANGATVRVQVCSETETVVDEVVTAPSQQKLYALSGTCFAESTNTVTVKFGIAGDEIVEIDRVQLRKLEQVVTMPLPQESIESTYEKEVMASYTMLDGSTKEYVLGWRFVGRIEYIRISAEQEQARAALAEAEYMFYFPHNDNDFVVPVVWDKEYARRYPRNVQIGYEAIIPLRGIELLTHIPKS